MEENVWKDEYNVGCDYVDNAHKKLFNVLRQTERLCREADYEKNKFACLESIKFLKNYTETHFAEEEAFMCEVNYAGYDMHKKLHDELRNETVPALSAKLTETDYSKEAVSEFLGVFIGWLTSHILIEDQAITGKAVSRYKEEKGSTKEEILENEVKRVLTDYSCTNITISDYDYKGVEIENAFCYEMKYENTIVVFASQNSLVTGIVGAAMGVKIDKPDRDVLIAYVQMVHNFVKPALVIYRPEELEKKSEKKIIDIGTLSDYFKLHSSICNLRWSTDYGDFALCIFNK